MLGRKKIEIVLEIQQLNRMIFTKTVTGNQTRIINSALVNCCIAVWYFLRCHSFQECSKVTFGKRISELWVFYQSC